MTSPLRPAARVPGVGGERHVSTCNREVDSVLPADPEAPSHAAVERRRSTSRCGGWPRLAASPGELREHRFLANAHLRAHAFDRARETVEAGLELAPDDAPLLASRAEAKAGLGDPEGALADWRRALELDPEDIGAVYSSAFLLEQEGRLTEAAEAWRSIIEWNQSCGHMLRTVWPRQELEWLRSA